MEILKATIIFVSIMANIVMYTVINRHGDNFSGTVQECWEAGGDTFYASKEYGSVHCDIDSQRIELKKDSK